MIELARAPLGALGLLCAVAVGVPSGATAGGLSAEDEAAIRRVEDYINSIETMRARFIQLNPNGRTVEGSLYLSRPGRMRFEYDPPVAYWLIADGSQVIFYDKELETPTYVSIDDTPLRLLLDEQVSLSNGVRVTRVEHGTGALRVTLVQSGKEEDGTVQITFSERPMEVRKWSMIDAQGVAVHIALIDARYGVELDPRLFVFKNPRIYGKMDERNDR
jgi:outer membrane lipoprotein-sorting protein